MVPITRQRPRGVLSDKDIWREIRSRSLVTKLPDDPEEQERAVQASSYDLHAGHIITAQKYAGEDGQTLDLQPGEMAVLATREILRLPEDITGLIVPRNGPAKAGLLVLNAGHVDPGYPSFVTAQVINLGKQEYTLSVGGSYFSIIFEYLSTPAERPKKQGPSQQEGLRELRQQATRLARSIFELQKEELEGRLREDFVGRSELDRELWKRWWMVVVVLFAYTVGTAGMVAAVIAALDHFT